MKLWTFNVGNLVRATTAELATLCEQVFDIDVQVVEATEPKAP